MLGARAFLLVAAALLAVSMPPAHAQDAPHLSPDVRTLYAHVKPDGVGNFMNTLVTDGLDSVSGPEGPAQGYGALANSAYTWTIPLEPALQRAVALDPAGNLVLNAYVGVGTGAGRVTVTTRLAMGGTLLLEGEAKNLTLLPANYPSSQAYERLTWTGKPAATALEPGQPLVWTVTATGTASNVYLGSTELRGRSNVVLPVLSVAPAPAAASPTRPLRIAFATPEVENTTAFTASTGIVQVDWTAAPARAHLNLTVLRSAGTLSVTVLDGANRTLAAERFAANATRALDLAGQAGTWRIRLEAAAFTGSIRLQAAPVQAGAEAVSGSQGPEGAATSSGKDAPLGPAASLGALAACALAARRWAKA